MAAWLAILWALAGTAAALARLRRVQQASAREVLTGLVRRPLPRTRAELGERIRSAPENPDSDRLQDVLSREDPRAAIAECNELLTDVGGRLAGLQAVPASAARAVLSGGLLLLILEVVTLAGRGQAPNFGVLGVVTGATAAGAIACIGIGRLASSRAREAREQWDRLGQTVGRLFSPPGTQESGQPRVGNATSNHS